MKNLATICLLALTLTSCTKKTATINSFGNDGIPAPVLVSNQFVFGEYDRPHMSNNIPPYTFCFFDTTRVFSQTRYFTDTVRLNTMLNTSANDLFDSSIQMPNTAYVLVKPFVTGFPQYLLAHPNATIGVTQNVPTKLLYIATVNGLDTTRWNINTDTTKLPAEIRVYTAQMHQALGTLWTIR